ncbi:ABC transporter permease [Allopusillimonas ginsengisoli]|uniref:ABC transporter permease n=1 Tax=Allopusillimonas ginsengisoli TaxID=453575 RepID=UPI0010205F53|nr:ABC transporter permease [Allopusillimonas ginsengisoli]TEA79023.1 ABC transporter permease [Allopusillimonas ginsengisoli]
MLSFIAKRLIATIPVMLMVAIVVFAILRLTPGDPAALLAGDLATPDQLRQIRHSMGLDEPLYIQFVHWIVQLLQGNLGVSLISDVPVTEMIVNRIGPTLSISTFTIIFSVLVAVPLGTIAAWRRGKLLDRAVMSFSVLGFSVPAFVVAYALIFVVSINLQWLPVQGYKPLSEGFWPYFQRLILPTMTLSTVYVALIARITRTSIIEVLGEDYIRTARAKGLKERAVVMQHALGNAAVPIITIIGIGVSMLIGGVVVTESVFNLPGLGRLVVEAVLARDYPVIQGLILLFSFVYILINLVVDILYCVVDPRIRY